MTDTFDTAEPKRPGGFLDLGEDDICQRAKKRYSRVSLALLVMILVANAVALAISALIPANSPLRNENWVTVLLSFAPLYCIGIPCAFLVMRPMPAKTPQAGKIGFGGILAAFIISIFFMQGGNILGTMLANLVSGGKATNPVVNAVSMEGWLQYVFILVAAPVLEELVFRKLLIDRTNRFGEKAAILFSAFAFALYHMNLYQFFYTFGLGLVFGYLYVRTGKLRITICLHALINALGSLVPMFLLESVQKSLGMPLEEMLKLTTEQMADKIMLALPFILFSFGMYALALAGLILLLVLGKRVYFEPAKDQLPKGKGFQAACLNVGFILYFLFCVALTVLTMVYSTGLLS